MPRGEISAKILLDSITDGASRLTTWELTYPRFIHSELLTHRVFSRNSASSRAIPTAKLRQRVLDMTATPTKWGANQKGMQASVAVGDLLAAEGWWLRGRDLMVAHHEEGEKLGLHKQIVNRVIEPWMMITVIVSGTDWANFFHQRHHKAAEDNFQVLAGLMREQFFDQTPTEVSIGGWHLPFIDARTKEEVNSISTIGKYYAYDGTVSDLDPAHADEILKKSSIWKKISVGRCARVSYLTHNGVRDIREDMRLHDQLAATASLGEDPMHASPFEHVAVAVGGRQRIGNFEGWKQYRKFFPRENGPDTANRCTRCGIWAGNHTRTCPIRPARWEWERTPTKEGA